jgi:hypothetical protein
MRVEVTVLASTFLLGTAPVTLAQNLNDNQLSVIAQSGIAKLADSEWKKLPQTELDCVNQKLRERGDSVQSLAQRGILPADPRTADFRSQCRSSSASVSRDQSSTQTKYAVDGLVLGSRVKPDSATYLEYKCSPSDQFDGFTWCQKTRNDQDRRGASTATYSILHGQDGNVVYVNRFQSPAFFDRNQADKEIQGYSRKMGETARIKKMPHRAGLPDGIIALWGKATLEPLDQDSIKILAQGTSPKKGLLVDFIGNFARSAKEGLPIYRISGGAGFLWAAGYDRKERGTLRFAAVDASGLSSLLPAQASAVIVQTSQQGNAAEAKLAELKQTTETPDKEETKTERQSWLGAENAKIAWKLAVFGANIGAILLIVALVRVIRSKKATKLEDQRTKPAVAQVRVQTHSPEKSDRDERDIKIGEEAKPRQFAETLQQPTVSLSELAAIISESVVPEHPAKLMESVALAERQISHVCGVPKTDG